MIRLGGSHGNLRLAMTIRNEGDRDAGRGKIDATFPLSASDTSLRWTDASGRQLPDYPVHAARIGDANLLTRELPGVAQGVSETVYATVPVAVPYQADVNEYPIRIAVLAEGADPAAITFPLRIGRDPSQ